MKEADSTSGCTAKSVRNRLKTKMLGKTLLFLQECTSTNDIGRKFAREGAPHGFLIVSETQTAGRGRLERKWVSPRGGIWMTLILRPPFSTLPHETLPLVGALSVAVSIHNQLGVAAKVRWPNDVDVYGSKVAGVIAESQQQGNSVESVLLGIGINANFSSHKLLSENINATTLMDILGEPVNCSDLICEVLHNIEDYLVLHPISLLELVRRNDSSKGRRVRISTEKETIEGIFVDYKSPDVVGVAVNEKLVPVNMTSAILIEYLS